MSAVRRLLVPMALGTATAVWDAAPIRAEVEGVHVRVFPWAAYGDYSRDVNLQNEPMYGGSVGLGFGRWLGVDAHVGFTTTQTVHGFTPYAVRSPAPPARDVAVTNSGADLIVNVAPAGWGTPYLLAGWQEARLSYVNRDSVRQPRSESGPEVGAGIALHLMPRLSIRAEVRDAVWTFPQGTPAPAGTDPVHDLFYVAGLELAIGGVGHGDADQDGIPNGRDKCPGTPLGTRVDANGCPIDSDADGIADGIDQCPDTPRGAQIDARGCPRDSDHDGVADGIDQCPGTPNGTQVDARGCPRDSDGDGVPDEVDQCSDTPPGTRVDARGCALVPDADNDGVPDAADRCPYTHPHAKVDARGCPLDLGARELELIRSGHIVERNIEFQPGSTAILPESEAIVSEIGDILIQRPRLQIEVGVHMDARGSEALDLDLSRRRARAVLDDLLLKFPQLGKAGYTFRGYRDGPPVAGKRGGSPEATHRRVEFKVLNMEELRIERGQRQLQSR
ncbi:MAG: OmpA family protein [Candidatus Eisenbacteria bacterium]|uniref:OmpA family protein n=1 Tax=Eiseniibacteriota bacterium TaxID=2212470 RepID=A0A538UC02_UNCEI|nr:MAG: OmpA family protein [Candidatus Eisenbacteria bacterium]